MTTRICSSGVLGERLVFSGVLRRGFLVRDSRLWERGRSDILIDRYSSWMRASALNLAGSGFTTGGEPHRFRSRKNHELAILREMLRKFETARVRRWCLPAHRDKGLQWLTQEWLRLRWISPNLWFATR